MENSITFADIFQWICSACVLIGLWRVYVKMGYEGWKALIPFYSSYIMFKELYGDGWRFLLLLIPLYGIYVYFKMYIDLGKTFGKSTLFGFGMALFGYIFLLILGFDDSKYQPYEVV